MIVQSDPRGRENGPRFVLMLSEHLELSGQLAEALGNDEFDPAEEPREEFYFVARRHDEGWQGTDDNPPLDPATGLPYNLAETPITREYTAFLLPFVPLACLCGAPFLLCRPVFEAMNRGRPGLVMATLRFAILTAPVAWLGMWVADNMSKPPLYGLAAGLLVVSAVTSAAFYLWLRGALIAQERSAT